MKRGEANISHHPKKVTFSAEIGSNMRLMQDSLMTGGFKQLSNG